MTMLEKRDGTFVSVTHSTSSDFDLIAVELRYVLRFMRDYGLTYSSSRKLFSRMLATTAISETLFDHVHVLLTGDERPAAEAEDDYLLLSDTAEDRDAVPSRLERTQAATEAQRKRKVRKPRTV